VANEVKVVDLPETAGFVPVEGAMMRGLVGEGAMINLVDLEPDSLVPLHSHPHEQIGYVVEGVMIMEIDGEMYEMPPGTAYAIPGDVMHSGRGGPEGCRVIDVFLPVREDYRERLERAESG
jgi:quercetin dioxygenase-like cupin family protein